MMNTQKITILKVHRDSEKPEAIKFEHRNFFRELNRAIATYTGTRRGKTDKVKLQSKAGREG